MLTRKSMLSLLALLLCVSLIAIAQAPTGIIEGTVTDESGAVIPNATVTITNKATGIARTATTNAEGLYSAPALAAGDYEMRVEIQGFKTLVRPATLLVGGDVTVNMSMTLGGTKDVVTVEGATTQINYESNQVQGVVERNTIQELPLNGRSYIQLAQLEPGVTIGTGSTAQFNALFTISVLGSGNRTVYSIDGGNVSDNIDVGGGISSMNFSQEVVQEFQLSSLNFDISTDIAAGGALNVITRSGSNDWHGSALFFYRDHNTAAYPNLVRSASDLNPYFVRKNPGGWLGGPITKNKLFFFFDYERTNQVQALSVAPTSPSLFALGGTYGSPYNQDLISGRLDYHLNDKNNFFLRYSHDGNSGFSTGLTLGDPSTWVRNTNWADQGIVGWTSTITPNIVNDLRVQYNYWNNHNFQANASECSAPCFGGVLPSIDFFVGTNLAGVGGDNISPQARNTRRYEFIDGLSWQKGSHRFKFGGDLNPTNSAGLWGFCTPFCAGAVEPQFFANTFVPIYAGALGGTVAAAATINALLPGVFNFNPANSQQPLTAIPLKNDLGVLNLPIYNVAQSLGIGVGVGSPSTPSPYDYNQNRNYNQYRAYFGDTWKVTKTFTLNYGIAWNAQTGFYNSDLAKPQYLAPILGTGSNNLGATVNNTHEFQPVFGFAWSPFKNNRTVFRGGGGIYWDSTPGYYKLREAPVIGPLGDGRVTLAASTFTVPSANTIFDFNTGGFLAKGAPIPLNAFTNLTIGEFQSIVNAELPAIQAQLFPGNVPRSGPYTTTGIDVAKQGVEIYPTHFPLARTYQTSLGVQHDFGHGMVLTADWARRQGENVSLGEQDYNHFNYYVNGVQSPVIPVCSSSQLFVPGQECSAGAITFWTDEGRSIYEGMLVKLQKRLSNHFQFTASYALQRETFNNVWNVLNFSQGYSQILPHHNFNFAALYQLPWGFDISMNASYISRSPVEPTVSSLDLPGTDPVGGSEPLPGLAYNCLNSGGCSNSALTAAVNAFNTTYAGTKNANGSTIGALQVPQNYSLSNPVTSTDVRITKTFVVKERYRFSILAESFNILNIGNETGQSYSLDAAGTATPVFGVPTQRVVQTFGSGGPRAFQFGARFSF
jgi:hypothetical protein